MINQAAAVSVNQKSLVQCYKVKKQSVTVGNSLIPTDSDCSVLLSKIIELYITVRSFAFTSKIMEQHKVVNKENLQKAKSLRTKLKCLTIIN